MKNKLLSLLSGSVLAVLVLAGCNFGNQDPPPEDNGVEDNGGVIDENGDNGMNGGNIEEDDGVIDNGNGNNGEGDGIMNGEGENEGPLDELEDEVEDPLDPNDEEENNNQ